MLLIITIISQIAIVTNSQQLTLNIQQTSTNVYQNAYLQPLFQDRDYPFDCTYQIYSYAQSQQEYNSNAPYYLVVIDNPNTLNFNIRTQFQHFQPTINTTTCSTTSCIIQITNNCPTELTSQNHYDIIAFEVSPMTTFTYSINCNITYNDVNYDLGRLIIIFVATIFLTIAVNFAKLNAFDGIGIEYNVKWIGLVSLSMLVVGLLGLFLPNVGEIVVQVASVGAILICCSLIFIELMYYFNWKILLKHFEIKTLKIRILDIVGLLLSVPVVIGWWFSNNNWILSNLISFCIVLSCIKVIKITSFKVALMAYGILFILYIIAAVLPVIIKAESVNFFFIYAFKTPFQIQAPIILPMYATKCSWISVTTVCFPGIIISYLRRFDQSRNTNIYLVTSIIAYFLGSIIWWIVNAFSYYPIPYSAFCEPLMMITFSIFAFKRKQLRTIWQGKFYDEEFVNKQDIDTLGQQLQPKKQETQIQEDIFRDRLTQKSVFFDIAQDSELQEQQTIGQNSAVFRIKNDQL